MKQSYLSQNPILIQATRNLIKRRGLERFNDAVQLARSSGITPDDWQADLLRSDANQMILLCSRQSGKSTVSSILALHEALRRENALVLILSPALRQSQELFRRVKTAFNHLNLSDITAAQESALGLQLSNNSRIIALPGKEATIRGFSGVSLLIVDEASRVEDALYQAVRPMLAVSGGRIVLLSTPFGKRGFFHHEWSTGGADWYRTRLTAFDCPRISNEWLEAERARIGDWWFRQEYCCEFVETDDQIFSFEHIENMFDESIQPLWN